ncbi:MAG: DUF2934 domain-containing protein [Burkholderiales bacterium]|nr:DUF2934 domain-containing protein [Burkholderiales bacterium]
MFVVESAVRKKVTPHERYAMISERAYYLGEERRRTNEPADPASDWLMAEIEVDSEIEAL